ncbi:PTS fructose transporter subunit IIA, partial [Lacticaseibacillus rhamnosus]
FYTLLRDRKKAKIVVNISFVDALTALLNHQNELSFVVQQVLDNPGVQEVSTGALIQDTRPDDE